MHGLAATRILKESEITGHVPIIALTAHAMKGDERVAREAGCNGYFTKPIDTRTFVETLTQFLPNQPIEETSSKTYAK